MTKNAAIGLALLAVGCLYSTRSHAEHYRVWLKAFIPNSGLDIEMPVPNSPGHFMIPGPQIVGIPIDSTCYNTNDRSFSSSLDADAKITVVAEFDVYSPGVGNFTKTIPDLGQTIRYDCSTGDVLATGRASNENVSVGDPSYDAGVVKFDVDADASNPLVQLPSGIVPSIKIHGTITLDTNSRAISFDGTIARFPSYEAYVSVDDHPPVTIFTISPDASATAWSLVFNNNIDPSVRY